MDFEKLVLALESASWSTKLVVALVAVAMIAAAITKLL